MLPFSFPCPLLLPFLLLKGKTQDVSALLSKFKMAQERHVQARREAFRKKSLQSEASTTTAEK